MTKPPSPPTFIEVTIVARYVFEMLLRGYASVGPLDYNDVQRVAFLLRYGWKLKRLDGVCIALMMLYVLWRIRHINFGMYRPMGDHFLGYINTHLSPELAVAVVDLGFRRRMLNERLFHDQSRPAVARFNERVAPVTRYWAPWHGPMAKRARNVRARLKIMACKTEMFRIYKFVDESIKEPESAAAYAMSKIA